MRFFDLNRVRQALVTEEFVVSLAVNNQTTTMTATRHEAKYCISAAYGDQVGQDLFARVLIESIHSRQPQNLASCNALGVASPCLVRLQKDGMVLCYPLGAEEVEVEQDLPVLLAGVMAIDRPSFNVFGASAARVEEFLGSQFGLIGDLDTYLRAASPDVNLIFASLDAATGALHINVVVAEGFLEDAAVYDNCSGYTHADFYDPHYRSSVMRDIQDSEDMGRTMEYKLSYAARWNRDHWQKYWRLRASVIANRLLFRTPLCVPKRLSKGFGRELDSVQAAIADRFQYRRMIFPGHSEKEILTDIGKKIAWHVVKKLLLSS